MAFRQASQSHGFWGNTLAMKLLIRNRTTPCCTFRPSYPLIPVIKEKKSGILLQEWPCLNKEFFHPRRNGKKFRLIWNGKILNLTTFCRISRFFFLGLQIFHYQGLASLLPSVATDGIGNNFNKIVYLNIVLNNITGPLCSEFNWRGQKFLLYRKILTGGGGGGSPLYKPYRPFWSGIGYGFRGNYRSLRTYLWVRVRKKEKYANSKWILRNILICCCSYSYK